MATGRRGTRLAEYANTSPMFVERLLNARSPRDLKLAADAANREVETLVSQGLTREEACRRLTRAGDLRHLLEGIERVHGKVSARLRAAREVQALRRAQSDYNQAHPWLVLAEELVACDRGRLVAVRDLLERLFESDDSWLTSRAVRFFERMGRDAWESLPVLRRSQARRGQADELAHVIAAAVRGVPERIAWLDGELRRAHGDASWTLCQAARLLGPEAAPLGEALLETVDQEPRDSAVAGCALLALDAIGAAGPAVIQRVIAAIDDDEPNLRIIAIDFAGRLPIPASAYLEAVAKRLADDEGYEPEVWEVAHSLIRTKRSEARSVVPLVEAALAEARGRSGLDPALKVAHLERLLSLLVDPVSDPP